jgi:hypothetical protein
VNALLAALQAGAFPQAAALLTPDAVVAVAAGDDHLRHSHVLGLGPEQGCAALARLGTGTITRAAEALDGEGTWCGELVRRTATDRNETLMVSATAHDAGLIGRVMIFTLPAIDRTPVGDTVPIRPLRPILERYFAALQEDRFDDAATEFGERCLYSHPPYRAGAGRVEFHGRAKLIAGLSRERGSSPARQVVLTIARTGAHAFVEGVVEGVPRGGTFFSALSLDSSGLIARYVACYTTPRIPSRSRPGGPLSH